MKKSKGLAIVITGMILFAAGFVLIKQPADPQGLLRTLPYLCIGVGCGMFGHGIGDLLSKKAVEHDPGLAKQIEINRKDERNVMLSNMAKAKGYDIMTYVFGALLLAYALMGASVEIIIPFVTAYLFVQLCAVYFRTKEEKKN